MAVPPATRAGGLESQSQPPARSLLSARRPAVRWAASSNSTASAILGRVPEQPAGAVDAADGGS